MKQFSNTCPNSEAFSKQHDGCWLQTSLQLGSVLLRGLGVMSDDVRFLRRMMRESMELRAQETVEKKENKETDWLVPFQVHPLWSSTSLLRNSRMGWSYIYTTYID